MSSKSFSNVFELMSVACDNPGSEEVLLISGLSLLVEHASNKDSGDDSETEKVLSVTSLMRKTCVEELRVDSRSVVVLEMLDLKSLIVEAFKGEARTEDVINVINKKT